MLRARGRIEAGMTTFWRDRSKGVICSLMYVVADSLAESPTGPSADVVGAGAMSSQNDCAGSEIAAIEAPNAVERGCLITRSGDVQVGALPWLPLTTGEIIKSKENTLYSFEERVLFGS